MLIKVLQAEPVPLRKIDQQIPADLENITMKCLEKEPSHRYESARALADDLTRFLEGEPILWRRPSITYRLVKKAKKHKVAVSIASIVIIIGLILAGMGVHARWTAAQRQQLSRMFGQEIERLESALRIAYMQPLHDISLERNTVRERMKSIKLQMEEFAGIEKGLGYYALGRGALALHDCHTAQKHLETAWNQYKYQEPEVAYALGRTLGQLYKQELDQAERIETKDRLELLKIQIAEKYREPALLYLRKAAQTFSGSPQYVQALIAFYENKNNEALTKTREAFKQYSWLYEAKKLEGDIYVTLGNEIVDTGQYERALEYFKNANSAYQTAIDIARSDSTNYNADCNRLIVMLQVKRRLGVWNEEDYSAALLQCENAVKADPENAEALLTKAQLQLLLVKQLIRGAKNAHEAFQKTVDTVQQVVALKPDEEIAYLTHGKAYLYLAETAQDYQELLNQAIINFKKATEINPNFASAHVNAGIAYYQIADNEVYEGKDPGNSFDNAIEAYIQGIRIYPNDSDGLNSLANTYSLKGEYEFFHGKNPLPSLQKSVQTFQQALQINPNNAYACSNAAISYLLMAQYEQETGNDPTTSIQKALLNLDKAIEINPNFLTAYENKGEAYLIKAEYELEQNLDPSLSLNKAKEFTEHAVTQANDFISAISDLGRLYELKARFLLKNNAFPSEEIQKSRSYINQALKIDDTYVEAFLQLAQTELTAAQLAIAQNSSPEQSLKKTETTLIRALQITPLSAKPHQAMAELYIEQAEWYAKKGDIYSQKVPLLVEKSLDYINKAKEINPALPKLPLLEKRAHALQ